MGSRITTTARTMSKKKFTEAHIKGKHGNNKEKNDVGDFGNVGWYALRPADQDKGTRGQGTKPNQIKLASKGKITTQGTGTQDMGVTRTEIFMTTGKKTGPQKIENHHLDGPLEEMPGQFDQNGKQKYKQGEKEFVFSSSSTARASV